MQGLFGNPGFAKGGAIAIADAAGKLLFRAPEIPGTAGQKMAFPELNRFQAGKAEALQTIVTSPLDGQERLFAFQKVEAFPYTVIVSSPVRDDLHQWRIQRYSYIAGFASIALLLLGLSFLAGRLQKANILLSDQAGRLEQQAHTDTLTGIGNRRYFFDQAERELARSRRTDKPLALLMLDIDYFKRINDTYGHDAGDAVLKALCNTGLATIRNIDIFARFGGEEFVILLPETTSDQATLVAERLRARMAETAVALSDGKTVSFTVSIGLFSLTPRDTDLETLLKQADTALYEAKNTGRNKVCAHEG
jgi:diguanylate cyclase (GGDEF)-like protein